MTTPATGQDHIALAELAALAGVTTRTVRNWVRSGLPYVEGAAPTFGGRKKRLFNEREALAWLEANVPGGCRRLGRLGTVKPTDNHDPAPGAAVEPEAAPQQKTPDRLPPAVATEDTETLLQMARNLETAERVTFSIWARAFQDTARHRDPQTPPPYGAAELSIMQRNWHENVTKRKQVEQALPKILLERGRYVDLHLVRQVFERAVTAMCQDLDQVGVAVAEDCRGKTARQIRDIVDKGISRARRHVSETWRQLSTT